MNHSVCIYSHAYDTITDVYIISEIVYDVDISLNISHKSIYESQIDPLLRRDFA